MKACLICGYTFVVEAAHVQAVKDFPVDALVKEVNARANLIPLCPNHHLELDRGKLKMEDVVESSKLVRHRTVNAEDKGSSPFSTAN